MQKLIAAYAAAMVISTASPPAHAEVQGYAAGRQIERLPQFRGVKEWRTGIAPAFLTLPYLHFLLAFIMIVKRSHALFQKEYRDNPQQQ